jgi:arylsulfatase A-like enzyme
MSFYGYKRNTTPNINNFFSNAFVFNKAIAPATLTYTDALSLFYSLSPQVHKAYVRQKKTYTQEVLKNYQSLPAILAKQGYETAAFVSDEDYEYEWGLGKTFKLYFDRTHYRDNGITFSPFSYSVGTKQLVPIASKWLEKNIGKKKFMFLQAYDLHCPFNPGGKFANLYDSPHSKNIPFTEECFMAKDKMNPIKMNGTNKFLLQSFFAYLKENEKRYYFEKRDLDFLTSLYDAELNQADSYLLELFNTIKKLKLDQNSIIVFLTEHGDYHGENGFFFKTSATAAGNLNNANLNIPLIIKTPQTTKKIVQNQIIQLIDIVPSLLEMLQISPDNKMQGKSFAQILEKSEEINDYAYGFQVRYGFVKQEKNKNYYYYLETIQDHEWKLDHEEKYNFPERDFLKEEYFLYDLRKDPNEKYNIASKEKKKLEQLKEVMLTKRIQYADKNRE